MNRRNLIDFGEEEEDTGSASTGDSEPEVEPEVRKTKPSSAEFVPQHPYQQFVMQPIVETTRISLTPFWEKDPVAWFRLTEAAFNRANVHDANLKFDLVLPAIPRDAVDLVRHILRDSYAYSDPYTELKLELVKLYTPNIHEQLNGIVYAPELGGQAPSVLMRKLLELLPVGEPAGLLFKNLFVIRMPQDIRHLVAKKLDKLPAKELGEYADSVWHVRNAKKHGGATVATLQTAEEAVEELTGAVAAMPAVSKGRGRGGKRGRGGGRGRGRGSGPGHVGSGFKYICLRHCKFGKDAYHCDDPEACQFSGNEAAGGQ